MIGNILIFLSLFSALAASYLFFANYRRSKDKQLATMMYYFSTGFIILASIYLFANIVAHNFQMAYIFEYSSRNLPKFLLYSSFFAGQEGSFLLWTLIIGILGIILIKNIKSNASQNLTLFIYSLIFLVFIILVLFNSPFKLIWEKYPNIFKEGFVPPDGRSLNPILENFWMIIHPPFLFLGFSILFVPFAINTASFISDSLHSTLRLIRRWQLIGSGILGIGLILGGVWAYESLGWGGWWGWDPVENASLVPWIISVILIHLLLIQKRTKGFIKSNFSLFLIQTVLIIYSTFLTRTGILQNSMHSFAGTSGYTYYILLSLIIILLFIGAVILLKYGKNYAPASDNISLSIKSSNFYMAAGMYIYLLIAIFIFFGTSYPLINSDYSIDAAFYNRINFIPLIISMLLLSVSFIFTWKERKNRLLYSIITGVIIIIGISLSIASGIAGIGNYLYIISGVSVISVSILNIYTKRKKNIYTGLAHLGLGILIIGIIFSGKYSASQIIALQAGESTYFNDKGINYIKSERFDTHLSDREKYRFVIAVNKAGKTSFAMPVMYIKDRQIYKEPAVSAALFSDIYVSPLALDSIVNTENIMIGKGQSAKLKKEKIEFKFIQFIISGENEKEIGAEVEYKKDGTVATDTIYTIVQDSINQFIPKWKKIPNSDINIGIDKILIDNQNMNSTKVHFIFAFDSELPIRKAETFTFEISEKPLMSFIWIGGALLIIGILFRSFKIKN